ncbi:MAG: hypothetical protein Q7S65_04230 [Nanoarchaeota archaeon]|nr:hypothetical protein [Nanoarchaeota archaeon]
MAGFHKYLSVVTKMFSDTGWAFEHKSAWIGVFDAEFLGAYKKIGKWARQAPVVSFYHQIMDEFSIVCQALIRFTGQDLETEVRVKGALLGILFGVAECARQGFFRIELDNELASALRNRLKPVLSQGSLKLPLTTLREQLLGVAVDANAQGRVEIVKIAMALD